MRKLAVIITLLFLRPSQPQILTPILSGSFPSGGAAYTCGETTTSGLTAQNNLNNTGTATPCSTGTDSNGYTVAHVYFYVSSGASSSHVYTAIYNDTTTCSAGTHCPGTIVCSDTTGVTTSASAAFVEDTPTGCGTLTASTAYWIAVNTSDAGINLAYQNTSTCPAPNSTSVGSDYWTQTAGTWTASPTVTVNNVCRIQYMSLTPQ